MTRFFLFLLLLSSFVRAASDKPNVIFIMADDLGYTDLACFGSKYYETPNIITTARTASPRARR
jgi:hypothetical protein